MQHAVDFVCKYSHSNFHQLKIKSNLLSHVIAPYNITHCVRAACLFTANSIFISYLRNRFTHLRPLWIQSRIVELENITRFHQLIHHYSTHVRQHNIEMKVRQKRSIHPSFDSLFQNVQPAILYGPCSGHCFVQLQSSNHKLQMRKLLEVVQRYGLFNNRFKTFSKLSRRIKL